MNFNTICFARKDDFVTRNIAGETVIVPVRGNPDELRFAYALNPTGTWIWERIDGKRDVAAILGEISAAFEVEPELAKRDVVELLADLESNGLVRRIDAHGSDG